MWQRQSARQTGANEAPLAGPRRWGGGGDGGASYPQDQGGYGRDDHSRAGGGGGGGGGGGYGGGDNDRGRSSYDDRRGGPPPPNQQSGGYGAPSYGSAGLPPPPPQTSAEPLIPGERKRKSRWGDSKADTGIMPTAITGGVDSKDLESYAVQLRLDEISRALRSGAVVPPDGSRSPSPPPTYDSHGRRTNTREVRYRKKLEDERMRLVDRQMKSDPNFKPPTEYLMAKRQNGGRPQDKVYIPVKEFPEINFFGLLVGPRGNSLKGMERESGAKISIRGKGSVKEGKGRPGGGFDDDENEELHCLIIADSEEKVQKCVKLINTVIETAASIPEGQNDHKRSQLRELAQLNGTLRDDENQVCQNCGNVGHRKYDCPEQKNWTAGIICRVCGGAGHMARDCTQRRGGAPGGPPGTTQFLPPGAPVDPSRVQQFDSEYASLMAELGETSSTAPIAGNETPNAGQPAGQPAPWNNGQAAPGQPVDENGQKIPPWRIPSNWNAPQSMGPRDFNRGPPQHHQSQHMGYGGQNMGYSNFGNHMGGAGGNPGYGGYQQTQPATGAPSFVPAYQYPQQA